MKMLKFAIKIAAATLTAAALCAAAHAASLTDIDNHWSKDFVNYGVEKGYINGYPDQTFKPDNSVTRAEFATMLNRALGITRTADINFFDVETNEWYYSEIQKAVYAGYVSGYENGAFLAGNLITRQEAAVILSRVATRPESEAELSGFDDADDIADWAEDAFEFACSKGYFSGDDLGNLNPRAVLTRSQAAKLIYTLVTGENIQNGDYTVTPGKAVCSETIFTDNVIFSGNTEDASLTLDGCRVLGSVKVRTKETSALTVKDSALSLIEAENGDTLTVTLADGASVKYLTLDRPAVLSGDGYENVYLNGSHLASGTVDFRADAKKVYISADAVVRAKKLSDVTVDKKASVLLQSGSFETVTVAPGAANSVITLASGVTAENLTVNAAASFMGSGRIQKARNTVSGITYETKPENLTGIADNSTQNNGKFEPSAVSPENGATKISVFPSISISFDRIIYDDDGDSVTNSYVQKCFELRRSSSSGTKVDFTATLSGTRRVILQPDDDLSANTRYYVIVKPDVFTDADGKSNAEYSFYFNTASSGSSDSSTTQTAGSVTFSPKNAATGVSTSDPLKITFSTAIYNSDGNTPSTSYLSTKAVELREKSTNGTKVSITATLSSTKKVITVVPDEPLKPDTRYYLIIASGMLENSSGKSFARDYVYFNTDNKLDMTVTPSNAQTGIALDSEILLQFNSEIYRPSGSNVTTSYLAEEAIELHRSSAGGTTVDFTAVLSSDRKTVRIIPTELEAGTRYYVVIAAGKIANASGSENAKLSSYFNTATAMAPAFSPVSGDEDVSPSSDIVIKFTDPLLDKDKKPITAEYVAEKVVTFKRTSSTGTSIAYEAKISSDYKTITLTPSKPLTANTTYYVAVAKNTLYNESGKANTAGTCTFKTTLSGAPDFLPFNGETDVDVSATVQITFDRKMYAIGGKELTTTYIRNSVVELYKENYDGAAVPFTVTLSADKQTFNIKPSSKLAGDTTYFVVVRRASLEDSSGNENALYTSTFTTTETVSTGVTMTPDNRETGVAVTTPITITFESAVYRPGGAIASNAYLANNAVELRKGSSTSGTKIECTASISADNKTITLTPVKALDPKTTYYIRTISGSLEYSNSSVISSKTSYFTTNDGKPVLSSVTVEEAGASYITALVTSGTDGTAFVTVLNGKTEVSTVSETVRAGEPCNITVTGLASGTSYTVSATVRDAAGSVSAAKTATAKTCEPFRFDVENIGSGSMTVVIEALCDGTVDIEYRNKTTGKTETRVRGLSMKEANTREFDLTDLDSRTQYEVIVSFTDSFGGTFKQSGNFTTTAPEKEELAITKLTLTDSNGDTYTADIADGKASLTIERATSVRLTGASSVSNASFSYNQGAAVKPGEVSQVIPVTPGETATVKVVLTSGDTGNTAEVTLSIAVNK